jgi:pimeloyl-[acyl-carrier protein] methyl ester esterase
MAWFADGTGGRLWYEECGTGRPVVFIHGWCMSSAIWRLQIEGLSGSFRIITVDLPGHGHSPASAGGFSSPACAEGIVALFDHLDLFDALLAGWSLGSLIALESFALVRKRLSGLVLIGGTPRFTCGDGFPFGLSKIEVDGMTRKVRRSLRRALEGFTARMFSAEETADPSRAAQVHEVLSSVPLPDADSAMQALNVLIDADLRDRLAGIDLPTLVVNGDSDVICLPEASEYLAQKISAARQVVFSGCGHAPFLTQSGLFNAYLVDFQGMVIGREH